MKNEKPKIEKLSLIGDDGKLKSEGVRVLFQGLDIEIFRSPHHNRLVVDVATQGLDPKDELKEHRQPNIRVYINEGIVYDPEEEASKNED